ncbi:MAG: type II/IV secretion system protein, partial [Verrucomicrobiae bacterium]|nr:type II/IV secretion system protein [Verrucomicrobiae bacterium]
MAERDDYLVEILIDLGFVTAEQVKALRSEAAAKGVGVVDLMLANKLIRPADVVQAKAAHFGVEAVNLREITIPRDVIALVPRHVARKFRIIPVQKFGNSLTVAIADPSDLDTLDSLSHLLGMEISFQVAAEEDIEAALTRYYGGTGQTAVDEMIQDITKGEVQIAAPQATTEVEDGAVTAADAPLIKLVNTMIAEAYRMRASDIHLEPLPNRFRVRYRIDGVLHEVK